ncbi:ATP-binding protein [Kordiimonas lipolytica]|uniref:histidine kinase n=1 Tax=Kordiimonas lipolytica TaxID=1662421 RepID=A0ABV8UH96_9PROT|nr:ATP-binding protein [Kordiimonas lipolytica]
MHDITLISAPVHPETPDAHCGAVFERFQADPNLVAIPVLSRGVPIGLLKRTEFLVRLADRFGRPLYEKRPVSELMDRNPLVVDHEVSIDSLYAMLIDDQRHALQEGFIVTAGGLYKGICTSHTLLQLHMKRAERRMKALDEARIEAEAATRSRSQFLANMSHELRTPLNAVIGFADFILAEQARGRSLENVWSYISDIRESGAHLLGVINSILDFTKVEANAFTLREDYEAPQEIIHRVVRMMTAAARNKKITLRADAEDLGVELFADLQVTKQMLINLVSNAIKFSPDGAEVTISQRLMDDGGIEIVVLDNGPGMNEEQLELVLQPFVQGDAGLSRRHEGTGLGLPLVKAFAEAHDGRLILESQPGVGTRAVIRFPAGRSVSREGRDYAYI